MYAGQNTGVTVSFSGRGKLEGNDIFSNSKEGMLIESSGNPFVRANRVYNGTGGGVAVSNTGLGFLYANTVMCNQVLSLSLSPPLSVCPQLTPQSRAGPET